MSRHRGDRVTLLALCVLLVATPLPPCLADALRVRHDKTNASLPSPVSVAPNQDWDGIDGSWNTFTLRIGEPAQFARTLVSTASQQTWAIHSLACLKNETNTQTHQTTQTIDTQCSNSRGQTFNVSNSKTWHEIGFYQLWTEKNLGLVGNGEYGYETVGLGLPGEEGPTIQNTTVGTLISENFWLGHFGVNAKPTNFTAFTDPSPSYMTYLFQQRYIPSLSFAYTAGAKYRFTSVLGSLTLGGYDSSRFIPNDLTFQFAPDNERDLVVGVVGIQANGATKSNVNLLTRDYFSIYIDSTVAELWLPTDVCDEFEKAFGLKHDNDTDLYLVDDLLHQTLLAEKASITFTLGQYSSNSTVNITLPYAAFDQQAKPPYRGLMNATNFFPIRRADKESKFVLGRTFLQEAYLTVDWERQNFTVSQCSWDVAPPKNIVPILSPKYTNELLTMSPQGGANRLTTGGIIGIAIGGGFAVAVMGFALAWWFWRKRQRRHLEKVKAEYEQKAAAAAAKESSAEKREEAPLSPVQDNEEGTNVFPKAELPADVKVAEPTSPGSLVLPSPVVEVENTERQIFEMPGDVPTRQEADGRQLSEKETMMVRERIYNGVDTHAPLSASPTEEAPSRRAVPITPSEVAMVNRRRIADVSPTSPRAPMDGAFLEANDTFFQPPARTPRDGRFLEAEDTLLSPISPLEGPTETCRRRFSYE